MKHDRSNSCHEKDLRAIREAGERLSKTGNFDYAKKAHGGTFRLTVDELVNYGGLIFFVSLVVLALIKPEGMSDTFYTFGILLPIGLLATIGVGVLKIRSIHRRERKRTQKVGEISDKKLRINRKWGRTGAEQKSKK